MSLLESFRDAYRNLELLPLLDERDLKRFRVDYGDDVIDELIQLVEDSASGDSKIIFSGHRGCGKSTLLAELSISEKLSDRYFVVLFSIAKSIEMSDVNHINVLFAIALNLMAEAEKRQVNIPKSVKDEVLKWFAEHTQTDTKEVKGEAGIGVNLLEVVSLKLQTNASVRNEIRTTFEKLISELVGQINIIAATIQAATKQNILVIIDDLDKLDLSIVAPIFRDNIKALCLPGFHIIYTIPMATLRDMEIRPVLETETNNQIVTMPVLKLFSKGESHKPDAIASQDVLDTLCAILNKRIPEELLDQQATQKLILYSGGVLRELIRIANECCRICLRLIRREPENSSIRITHAILEEAVNKLRNDFSLRLGKVDYEILQTTYQAFMPDDPAQEEFLDLLHNLYVLEYRNRKIWYDIHPIVVELLQDRDLI